MRDFQDKNKNGVFRRIFYSTFGLVFLTILVLAFGWGVMNFMLKMEETERNKEIAEEKLSELEKRKSKLEQDILQLSTDKGKEKIFREDFGMGREGEGLIVVVEEKKDIEKEEVKDIGFFPSVKIFFSKLLGLN